MANYSYRTIYLRRIYYSRPKVIYYCRPVVTFVSKTLVTSRLSLRNC